MSAADGRCCRRSGLVRMSFRHRAAACRESATATDAELAPVESAGFLPDRMSSAIHRAAFEGKVVDLKMLLSSGTDIEARTGDGDTPMMTAATQGHLAIVRIFCEHHGAAVNAMDQYGDTALHRAARFFEIVQVLLACGALVNTTNSSGDTPLHSAAWHGDVRVMRLLVGHRADVDARGHDGERPLAVAARRGKLDAVRFLLERGGAVVSSMDARGQTALQVAAEAGGKLRARHSNALPRDSGGPLSCCAYPRHPCHEPLLTCTCVWAGMCVLVFSTAPALQQPPFATACSSSRPSRPQTSPAPWRATRAVSESSKQSRRLRARGKRRARPMRRPSPPFGCHASSGCHPTSGSSSGTM